MVLCLNIPTHRPMGCCNTILCSLLSRFPKISLPEFLLLLCRDHSCIRDRLCSGDHIWRLFLSFRADSVAILWNDTNMVLNCSKGVEHLWHSDKVRKCIRSCHSKSSVYEWSLTFSKPHTRSCWKRPGVLSLLFFSDGHIISERGGSCYFGTSFFGRCSHSKMHTDTV